MNRVFLIGNCARDIEAYTTQSGIKTVKFTLAVNRKFRDKNGVREADFIPCVVWRERAEFAEKYIVKGKKLAVCGELQTRSYETQDGQKRYITEVQVDEIELLGAKGEKAEAQEETKEMTPADDEETPF